MREPLPSPFCGRRAISVAIAVVIVLAATACGAQPTPAPATGVPPAGLTPSSAASQAPAATQPTTVGQAPAATQAPAGQTVGATGAPSATRPPATTAAPAAGVATSAATRPAATQAVQAAATAKPGISRFAGPEELNSYRMKMVMWDKGGDRSNASTIITEWVKSPPARHTTMGEVESITIGDTTWTKIMGRWVQQTTSPATTQQAQSQADQLLRQIEMSYKELGSDTINGVTCRKYSYSGEGIVHLTEGPVKGDYNVSGQGEMWVADQQGLPQVIVRNYGTSEIKAVGGGQSILNIAASSEVDYYDLNQPITILPPQGAVMTAPATTASSPLRTATATRAPASPTALPAVTRTPSPAPGAGTSTQWTDDVSFDKAYDRSWYGTPGVDATIGTSARPGYLRFEAGSGNDLFPGNNLDAPTLWRLVTRDILAETVVEFDPTEDYQGAGLFYWQDEDNFVRLERCFGGLGGIDSGICLLRVQNGEVEILVSPIDVPTTATRVGLRLQRLGDSFSAWWADASGGPATAWQPLGSFDLALTPVEQPGGTGFRIGMLLVVDRGAASINADFDYYRSRKP